VISTSRGLKQESMAGLSLAASLSTAVIMAV